MVSRTASAPKSPVPRRSTKNPSSPYTMLKLETRNAIALVTLDRPEVHNAFDETLIAELSRALRAAVSI